MKFFRPFQHLAVAVMTLLGSAAVPYIGETAEFTLMPSPQTVHIGHFASNLKPVLSIESGDTVTIDFNLRPPRPERGALLDHP
jgi:hypothetical protein